jgi:hypothetical protein
VPEESVALRIGQWSHYREFSLNELMAECVLLQNGLVAPTLRAIELGDDRGLALDADLIDAILEAVQGRYPQIGDATRALHCVEHEFGREARVGMRIAHAVMLRRYRCAL